jgi:carboxylesterase type B
LLKSAATLVDAWIHFARTGNPSRPGIPTWTPFSLDTVTTMIFDNQPNWSTILTELSSAASPSSC